MRKTSGFSLAELLIAGAILGILLTVLTSLFINSGKANRKVNEISDQHQQSQAARQVLQYELGLAGYRGVDSNFDSRTFNDDKTIFIDEGSGANPDTITIRYYEDRSYDGTESTILQEVTFSIDTEDGTSHLFRQQDDEDAVAIIPDITNLKVMDYILNENDNKPYADVPENIEKEGNLSGLELQITYANEDTDTVVVVFQNSQWATLD